MFKDKKVIIFDMDGTLIDSVGVWNQVDRELIRRLGNVKISEEEVQKQRDAKLREYSKEEKPYSEYCRYLGERYESLLTPEEIHALRYDIANEFLVHEIDYKPSVEKVLQKLKESGKTLVIATTTRKKNMDIYRYENKNIRKKAAIDEYFTLVYTREDVKEMKPHPEIYLKVMETLGVEAKDCLIFEDSLIGVEAANRAGVEVVAIYDKYSEKDNSEIQERATYYMKDFDEVEEHIR